MKVLVVACHPDDETLGVGGSIVRHVRDGDEVSVCLLKDGAISRHDYVSLQKECAEKACAALGVHNVVFCNFADQGLDALPLLEVTKAIEAYIDAFQPDTVYTHFENDANKDHRIAFQATLVACRPIAGSPVTRLLCYETASSTEWGSSLNGNTFSPNVFVDISDALDQKIEAMSAYAHTHVSEVRPYPHPRSYAAIQVYARHHGIAAGMHAAEAFMLVRELRARAS